MVTPDSQSYYIVTIWSALIFCLLVYFILDYLVEETGKVIRKLLLRLLKTCVQSHLGGLLNIHHTYICTDQTNHSISNKSDHNAKRI